MNFFAMNGVMMIKQLRIRLQKEKNSIETLKHIEHFQGLITI